MNRRDFVTLVAGAALGGVVAGQVAGAAPAVALMRNVPVGCPSDMPLPAEVINVDYTVRDFLINEAALRNL